MEYYIYTDGAASSERNVIGCAYFIMTSETFIHTNTVRVENCNNPTQAETIAIGVATMYMLKNVEFKDGDTVGFYSDCLSTIEFCKKYIDNDLEVWTKNTLVSSSIQQLRDLRNIVPVSFIKVKGHKGKLTPNTYVDRLATFALYR